MGGEKWKTVEVVETLCKIHFFYGDGGCLAIYGL